MAAPVVEGRRIRIRGTIQGVGFRPWVYRLAAEIGITGRAQNTTAGVTIDAFADAATLDEFVRRLRSETPRAARIEDVECSAVEASGETPRSGFVIAPSDSAPDVHVSIPPDLATCARTTMALFEMCPACRREYRDVADRRFHAQPNACPVCGPALTLHSSDGTPLDVIDPVGSAARALRDGLIVALKGLGGFHLACDATSPTHRSTICSSTRRTGRSS